MSSDVDQASETKPPYRGDDRILIPGILATFTVAVLGSTRALEMDAIVTAVFLASGVAMLVFRFLGGISSETSFNTGAFRVGGSLAALIGCAWYFNGELRSTDIETIFEPKYTTWVPIDKSSGALVDLKVNKKSVPFAREEVRKNLAGIDLSIAGKGVIAPSRYPDQPLGRIDSTDLGELLLKVRSHDITNFRTSSSLHANSGPHTVDRHDFSVYVGTFNDETSHIIVLNNAETDTLFNGKIFRRNYEIFNYNSSVYLVGIGQLSHTGYTNSKGEYVRPFVQVSIGNLSESVKLAVP